MVNPFNCAKFFFSYSQSNVNFLWITAQNAISYEVIITNLSSQSQQTFSSNLNQTTITLTKAEPYYWKVISIDANGNQSTSGIYAFRTN